MQCGFLQEFQDVVNAVKARRAVVAAPQPAPIESTQRRADRLRLEIQRERVGFDIAGEYSDDYSVYVANRDKRERITAMRSELERLEGGAA